MHFKDQFEYGDVEILNPIFKEILKFNHEKNDDINDKLSENSFD